MNKIVLEDSFEKEREEKWMGLENWVIYLKFDIKIEYYF